MLEHSVSQHMGAMPVQLVWFKRDLRIHDHAPLQAAVATGDAVLPLYIIEPALWQQADASARQWDFLCECLQHLRESLTALGASLVIRVGEAPQVLDALHARYGVATLFSHEETGNNWTYQRDIAVAAWARRNAVGWTELPQHGVVRRLKTRDDWAARWEAFMALPRSDKPTAVRGVAGIEPGQIPTIAPLEASQIPCPQRQPGGRPAGVALLKSFIDHRGAAYHREMSSPLTAAQSCSRLSPHLAFGTLSMREVLQACTRYRDRLRAEDPQTRGLCLSAINAYIGRLHWHCHFIQKLEDGPQHEWKNVHSAFNPLRAETGSGDWFRAWCEGRTGYPFIDACMRSLRASGWINFRMRAMLMSFASYQLWLHWRPTGLHLARLFTDYEPGIHWNQVQMQSGTTGINTVRIYNPVKQSLDQDADGQFIKTWIPELAAVPAAFIHEPWKMSTSQQQTAHCLIGQHYPAPVVDHLDSAREARKQIYAVRKSEAFQQEARQVLDRHGSRKPGADRSAQKKRSRRVKKVDSRTTDMFER